MRSRQDVHDGDGRHLVAKSPIGDQTSETQPEAVKDNPPRAPTAQRLTSLSLKRRSQSLAPLTPGSTRSLAVELLLPGPTHARISARSGTVADTCETLVVPSKQE